MRSRLRSVCAVRAFTPIACWQVRAAVAQTGSEAAAEALARRHGYAQAAIDEARRRCWRALFFARRLRLSSPSRRVTA